MSRNRRSWAVIAALTLAMSVFAACSDLEEALNGPDIPTDTEMGKVALAMNGVVDDYFVANSEAFESLETLGPIFGSGFTLVPLVASPVTGSGGSKGMQSILRLVQSAPQSIPSDALGTTYGYNSTTGNYEATEQTGAPANGVRFLLYEISGSSPVTPLNEIGYVDVAMASGPPSVSLVISMVIDGVTVLSLSPSGLVTLDEASLNIPGYVSDPTGSNQLNFNAGLYAYSTITTIGYSLNATADAFLSYTSSIDTSEGTENVTIVVMVGDTADPDYFDLGVYILADLSGNIDSGRAYVTFPSYLAADISGTLNNPTVTGISEEGADPIPTTDIPAFIAVFQALRQIHAALATYFGIGLGLLTAGLT